MDTVTQALLGGAVGFAVAGKKSPRKAVLWGAAIAVLPDLDVFIPYPDDLASVTNHRSWSHSWIIQTLLAPLLAFMLHRLDKVFDYKHWFLLVWLALVTHSGLDALTVYGTQLFWPFMPSPYSGGSVFIIDLVYTLPLLIGFVAVVVKPMRRLSRRVMLSGLSFSCIYLLWGVLIQTWMYTDLKAQLEQQGIASDKVLVTATPFNTLLWRVLVIDDHYYYEGFRSVFDSDGSIKLNQYRRIDNQLDASIKLDSLQRLAWFTNDFYRLDNINDTLVATDLRMGLEPSYFFKYELAQYKDNNWLEIAPMRVRSERNAKQGLAWTWQRIWHQDTPKLADFSNE